MSMDDSEMPTPAPSVPGERLDGFTLIRRLGKVGAIATYLGADDTTASAIQATVLAVKVDEAGADAFMHASGQGDYLRGHPGVVGLVARGITERGRPYVVNDIREGGSLREHLAAAKRLSVAETLLIGRTIGDAVAATHRDGRIHGSIQPAAILLDRYGRPSLAGIGLTTALTRDAGPGDLVRILGIEHTAPEVLRGGQATPQADVYSFASVLYHCSGGRPPFKRTGHSAQEQLARKLAEEAPALSAPGSKRAGSPSEEIRALGDVLSSALAADPERRPTMELLLASLGSLGSPADALWPRHLAVVPALQREVDRHLADGSSAAAPRPVRPSELDRVVRPIVIDEPVAPSRRDRDNVLTVLTADPQRERRRRMLIWSGLGLTAAALSALALNRPAASGPVGSLRPVGPSSTSVAAASAGALPSTGQDNTVPAASAPGAGPRVIGAGSATLDDNGVPVVESTITLVAPATSAPGPGQPPAPAPTTAAPVAPTPASTRPPAPATTAASGTQPTSAPATTAPPAATIPPTAPPPPPTTPAPATTIGTTTTTTTTTLPPATTAPPTTADSSRPFINGISVRPNGDGSFSISGDGEKCAAWGWSLQSDDGSISTGTGLKYPNGNCFRTPPGYSTAVLPAGGYTVTLRLKSTSNGRENSSSKSFTV